LDRSLKRTTSPIRNGQCPVARFDTYFRAVSADTRELIDKAFALRYQVYCLERQFEDPSEQPRGLETDQFDRHSIHSLVFHRPQEEPIGTARLILPQARPDSLPIQSLLKKTGMNACKYFPNHAVAEVSRFAISKEFRRRKVESGSIPEAEAKRERHGNLPCLGLVQMVLRQSIELGIEYWGAVMEPQLLRMLALMGIRFQPIGPLVSYHGLRQPSFCHVPVMLRNMALTKPESWAIVTNNGELMPNRTRFETELRRVA
jgi:N-acyl amino acid synthase of PEP-CTERM/exosortase system